MRATATKAKAAAWRRPPTRRCGLYVTGAAGVLLASADNNFNLGAAQVSNQGTGLTQIKAGGSVNLQSVQVGHSEDINWNANNALRQSNSQEVGSQIHGGGAVNISAQNDIKLRASSLNAAGALGLKTQDGSINIEAGQSQESFAEARQTTSKGFASSKTTTTRSANTSTTAQGSELGGQTISIDAAKDLSVKGSSVVADEDVTLKAGGNVSITAAQNTQSSSDFTETKKSGLMSSGGIGFTVGKQQQSLDQQSQSTTAAASTVGSTGGNVSIKAGQTYSQTGSDVLTPHGNIAITAQKVDITEERETGSQSTEQRFKQSGLTVALSGGVIDTAQAAMQGLQGATGGGSDRSKALNALIAYGKGADLSEKGKAVAGAYDKNGLMGGTGADGKANPGAAAASGIKISVSVGSASSQSNSTTTTNTGAGSTVKAGGNVTIRATENDLTVQGSKVQAAGNTSLNAAKDVNILASADTETNRSTSKSSAASVGVSFGVGAGSAG